MLNILSILGPSRGGKSALIPIVSAIKNIELPFNTPDLDWYIDAYNAGDISADALCKISANYLLCYSWYGHLGRHINLRPDDHYGLQRLMPNMDLEIKHSREDKDREFINFLEGNDNKKFMNVFQWDLAPEIYEIFERKYPINTNPLYCYRSPYYLFTAWISSNRIKRSLALSRMFKYDATNFFHRTSLISQFEGAKNDSEHEFNKKLNTYKFKEIMFDNTKIDSKEEDGLIKVITENKENAMYWSKKNMLFRFEHIVSQPKLFVDYMINRFNIEFDDEALDRSIILMNQRPVSEIIEMDLFKIKNTLDDLGCNKKTIDFIISEQEIYINSI
jgi:hypothetical protein